MLISFLFSDVIVPLESTCLWLSKRFDLCFQRHWCDRCSVMFKLLLIQVWFVPYYLSHLPIKYYHNQYVGLGLKNNLLLGKLRPWGGGLYSSMSKIKPAPPLSEAKKYNPPARGHKFYLPSPSMILQLRKIKCLKTASNKVKKKRCFRHFLGKHVAKKSCLPIYWGG